MKRLLMLVLTTGALVWSAIPAARADGVDRQPRQAQVMFDASPLLKVASTPTALAPAPSMIMTEGAILVLDLKSSRPNLLVVTEERRGRMLAMDPQATFIWNNSRGTVLDQFRAGPGANRLRVGQHVRVSHVLTDGRELALSIQLVGD